ncbi:MAG: aminotransferase class I/II-fold pyridoxal phosphate-dependent enzyme [Cyclobacteriaceae bacterium]|nr:aminotransferase class I/II-fold pyridoxal phosphate-dependent enzyme [Cyclobacteriaceae bacterium]
MIELRSDTFTKPSKLMLEAMMVAQVGDDVFGDDPTVNLLEEKMASIFEMEASVFCPSGTMANQIGIRVHTQPQDEVICDKNSHVYLYEGGGMASNSGVSPALLDGDRGRITASQIEEVIKPDDVHAPVSRLVSLENTMNKGGGSCYDFEEIKKIRSLCDDKGLALHLDGARLYNALAETEETPAEYGEVFDTISICLSKGLGAPIGSILLGSKTHIKKARRVRKVFGGGMRQAGYLAAAGLYALNNNVERLKEDHQRARALGKALSQASFVEEVMPVDTNIVIFSVDDVEKRLHQLKEKGVLGVPFGGSQIRFVTHLGFTEEMLEQTVEIIKAIN